MPIAVIQGATLQCSCGSAPSKLLVDWQSNNFIEGPLAATVMDHKPGLNILPFGTCSTLSGPCVPATPAPWLTGSTTNVIIGNGLALRNPDKLVCTVGGMISIVDPGQGNTLDT